MFHDKGTIRKHILTHGEKLFICPIEDCKKKFSEKSKLKRHSLVHSKIKKYKCSQCGKTFSLAFNLRTHERTHTGEKPFICNFPGCFRKFSQSSNLSSHLKNHQTLNNNQNNLITIEELLSDEYTGTLNINNLNKLNFKYEKIQLEHFQKGNIKGIHNLHNINHFFDNTKNNIYEANLSEQNSNLFNSKGKMNQIKTVAIVYNNDEGDVNPFRFFENEGDNYNEENNNVGREHIVGEAEAL